MTFMKPVILAGAFVLMSASLGLAADKQMGFFVTSVGIGNGGNLGGLTGADAQ